MLRESREFCNEVVQENGGMQQISNITDLLTWEFYGRCNWFWTLGKTFQLMINTNKT